jgi:hypothetical protein
MSGENRLFASAYLKHLARMDDPTHQAKLGARMRRMDAGGKVTLDTAKRLDRELRAAGL